MTLSPATDGVIELVLADEAETARLGADLAPALRAGDVLALSGDLGAGKSTLARALVRALAQDDALDVPSPTFTLVQSYATETPVHHLDLYRLAGGDELDELGLDEMLSDGAALIEWPERAGDRLPKATVRVTLSQHGDGRLAIITGGGPVFRRIARSLAMRDLLRQAGWGAAARRPLSGDASARGYEVVTLAGHAPRLLMDSPPLALGPPVRDGKAYAEIAHTARNVSAFVAIDRLLAEAGFAVPDICARDLDRGFLLISHLGTGHFLDDGRPVAGRYAAAAALLADLHRHGWPHRAEAAPGVVHEIPPFDRDAMLIEAELLLDWYTPYATGAPASQPMRGEFLKLWNDALDRIAGCEQSLVLRDYHSPNIIWRPERTGPDRMGLIDFQDALIGPAAYDLASLAMDARVTILPEIERATVDAYVAARERAGSVDAEALALAYATMAAQRNTKILGIFVRLNERDGKPAYLKHLPRIRDYLSRALSHPALAQMRRFYVVHGIVEEQR
jgi:tRNA threonylcarbamoyl adenosine modification protein YjeE